MEEVKSNDHSKTTTATTKLPTTPGSAKPKKQSRTRERLDNDDLLKQALAYSRTGAASVANTTDTGVSKPSVAATSAGAGEAGEDEGAEIRATAAALLRRLIVDKQESLRAHFHKIPFMPQARHWSRTQRGVEEGRRLVSLVGGGSLCLPSL